MTAVRTERAGDADRVRAVHLAAFGRPDEAALVDALRGDAAWVPELSLVADDDGEIVGHLLMTVAALEPGPGTVLLLGPVGVLPARQGRGVGGALIREGLRRARTTRHCLVVLLGHPDYYPRFGFRPARELGVDCPLAAPADAWMALRLPAHDGCARGTVRWAAPFDAI